MPVAAQPKTPLRWRSLAILVAAGLLFFGNFFHPVVRFASVKANEIVGIALAFLLPWSAVAALFRIGRRWSKVIAILAIVPAVLYSGIVCLGLMMTGLDFKDGRDLSFAQFQELHWKGSYIHLYRTDGGAMTDFGVEVRQERTIVPGLEVVRRVGYFYHCYSLDVSPTDSGIALTDPMGQCRNFVGQRRDYRLKRFVYF